VGTVNNTEASGVGTYSTIQGTNGMSVVSGGSLSPAFGSGNALSLANNTNTYYRAFNGGSAFTLNSLSVNETLKMSFAIRFDGSFAGADNFSFGFVNFASPDSILYANVDLSASGGLSSEFRYRDGSFNMSDAGGSAIVGSTWTQPSTTTTTSYSFDLSVTKLSTGFLLEYSRDGSLLGNSTVLNSSTWATTMAGTSISGIAIRHSNTPNVVTYLDNVYVATVPEPGTVAMLALGLGVVLFRRRSCYRGC